MLALIIGIVLIAFTVIAALPMGLAWGQDILLFLRGGLFPYLSELPILKISKMQEKKKQL